MEKETWGKVGAIAGVATLALGLVTAVMAHSYYERAMDNATAAAYEDKISELDEDLWNKSRELDRKTNDLRDKTKELDAAGRSVERLRKEIAEAKSKGGDVEELEQQLAHKELVLQELTRNLAKAQIDAEDSRAKAAAADAALAKVKVELTELVEEVERLTTAVRGLKNELAYTKQQNGALTRCKSKKCKTRVNYVFKQMKTRALRLANQGFGQAKVVVLQPQAPPDTWILIHKEVGFLWLPDETVPVTVARK